MVVAGVAVALIAGAVLAGAAVGSRRRPQAAAAGRYGPTLALGWCSLTIAIDGESIERVLARCPIVRRHARGLQRLYAIGALVWIPLMAIAASLFAFNIGASLVALRAASGNAPRSPLALPPTLIVPLVPGVTFPWDRLADLFAAVLVAVVCHELGHAVCAAIHQVPIARCGVRLWWFVPSAFVEVSASALAARSIAVRTAIAAAGILHNLLLSTAAALLLCAIEVAADRRIDAASDHPWVAATTLDTIAVPDRLIALGAVRVGDARLLPAYVDQVMLAPGGVCVDVRAGANRIDAPDARCFRRVSAARGDGGGARVCIRDRSELSAAVLACDPTAAAPCGPGASYVCLVPVVDGHRVVHVRTANGLTIYIGDPRLLAAELVLSNLPPALQRVQAVLALIASISLSVALLNAAPVEHFDGHHLMVAASSHFGVRGVALAETVLRIGSLTLGANVVLSLILNAAQYMSST